jgi:hypothetical protein
MQAGKEGQKEERKKRTKDKESKGRKTGGGGRSERGNAYI